MACRVFLQQVCSGSSRSKYASIILTSHRVYVTILEITHLQHVNVPELKCAHVHIHTHMHVHARPTPTRPTPTHPSTLGSKTQQALVSPFSSSSCTGNLGNCCLGDNTQCTQKQRIFLGDKIVLNCAVVRAAQLFKCFVFCFFLSFLKEHSHFYHR